MKRVYRITGTLIALLMVTASLATAQKSAPDNGNVKWTVLTPAVKGKPGDVVKVKIKAEIAAGSHMYTTMSYPADAIAPQALEVTVGEKNLLTMSGKLQSSPKGKKHYDESFEIDTEYWEGTVTLTVPVKIAKKAEPGEAKGWVNFLFQTCDAKSCKIPTDMKLEFGLLVEQDSLLSADTATVDSSLAEKDTAATADSSIAAGPDTVSASDGGAPVDTAVAAAGNDAVTGSADDVKNAAEEGLGALIALGALMGLVSLATPCVFPMVPITVSFFTKRPQSTRWTAMRDAGLYAIGIILTFTGIGVISAALFGATGINQFATNPFVNLALATLFVVLALNLFGLFEIQLPTSILNRLNRRANEDSVMGVILMGVVFSLTSFTCTAAFVGTVLTLVEQGEILKPIIGMLAFSTVFAAPFFLLALFPAAMKALPKSGGWLNSVKVVMGFLEIAFAVKFISNADLVWQWGLVTRELFLAIWIAVAVLITFYLLGRFQLPHDSPVDKVGPVRVLFSVTFLAFGFWLLTGMFGGQLGELDALAPPQEYPGKGNTSPLAQFAGSGGEGPAPVQAAMTEKSNDSTPASEKRGATTEKGGWFEDDFEKALAASRETGKPLFVDFTGYTCTNCRWMERNMFTRSEIAALMNQYVLLRLYTDGRQPVHKKNQKMLTGRFQTSALPYYVVLSPQDSVLAKFDGMTREPEQFVRFLQKGIAQKTLATATTDASTSVD